MPKPWIVIRQVSLIDEIPLIARLASPDDSREMAVPFESRLNVLRITIGIFLW